MQSAISDLTENILKKKNDLIINRVYDLANVQEPFDLYKECNKMFPRIRCVQRPDSESYYWNNGTEKGLLLITFFQVTSPPDFTSNKITLELKYK